MKKQLVSLFAMACMVFASSCSQEEVVSQSTGNEVTVKFTAHVRNDVKSRAVGDDTNGIDKLVFAVYDENKELLEGLTQEITTFQDLGNGKKKADINVVLVKGQTYSFAFWAQDKDYSAYSFNPATKKVSINYGQKANDKLADAFFANFCDYKVTGSFEKEITLKRPFAQVNFLTTQADFNDAKIAGFEPDQSSIVVENAATSLYVLTGEVEGSVEAKFNLAALIAANETTTILDASGNVIQFDGSTTPTDFRYLATAYFLPTVATAETKITASMSAVQSTSTTKAPVDLTAADIKARRNYRTNIYGNLLTSDGAFKVTIDPGFDGYYSQEQEEETTQVVGTIEEANDLFAEGETNVTITEVPDQGEESTIKLPKTSSAATVNFAFADNAAPDVTIQYADNAADGEKPANIEVNGNAGDLVINAPNSTVALNGEYNSVTATTAANTLIVTKGSKITSLTLNAGNAEIYYDAVTNLVKAEGYTDKITYLVDNGENFAKALADEKGDIVKLLNDIEVDADNTITIAASANKTLELDGKILSSTTDGTGNRELFLVKGTFNVNNGTITTEHVGDNMGWSYMSTIFDITAGGSVVMNNVIAENLGGTDMNFVAHLNNWGTATLTAENCEFNATYCGVRVFNSGNDMNNVTIKNSKLTGKSMAFWVHNYIYENKGDATLNLHIYNNNNTFEITGTAVTPIRYGFSDYYYYNESGKLVTVEVKTEKGLNGALDYVKSKVSGDITISLLTDVTADVTVTQKADQKITIQGNNKNFNGVITVDGKSARYETAGLTIQDVNFTGDDNISADAYVNLGGNDNIRYTSNVTVKDCTFSTTATNKDVVAVKSYTGGDHNLNIIGCTANTGMHSLAQLTNIEKGLKFEGCKVYSKNGVNLNNTPTFDMDGCTFDTKGYAVRVGVKGSVNTVMKTFKISNSTLKSACEDGDAVIIFRDNAKYATLNLTNTTLTGTTEYSGAENAIILINGVPTITVPESNTEVVISAETVKVTVPAEVAVAGDKYEIVVKNESTETDKTTGETTVAFDLTMYKNDEKVSGSAVYAITKNIGTGLFISEVTHNGTALTKADTGEDQTYTYDSATGILTIYTASFSPFEVTYANYKDYVRNKNFFYGGYISVSTGSDLLPIVAIMPEITKFSVFDGDTRITDAVTFRFSDVKKETINENSYKVSVNLAILDDKGNDLELKPGMPSTINGKEYLHVYMNLDEVQTGYSISEVKVGDTTLTKTESSNPATGEYWIGSNPKDLYFQSKTAGLIEVTLTK